MKKEEAKLTAGAGLLLIFVGLAADAAKIGLDALFGIGLILDPLLITPIVWLVFWITLNHCGISMMSGKRAWAGWSNLVFSLVPGLDAFPDWTAYAVYLNITKR